MKLNINYSKLLNRIKTIPKYLWFLLAVLLIGIFLRTYNFHDWLHFENDQLRDAILVSDVLDGSTSWPLLGPTMRKSSDSKDELFHIGPIYYYFQILSANFFGNEPEKLGYPDLFFSFLSIPLLFIFLKRYFSINTTLILVSLYTISFFSIRYSRFAWNPNLIPFFTILFLFSLLELLLNKEKTNWIWVVAVGIAIGIGIQLHIMLLVLFSAVTLLVFSYLLVCNRSIWKKLAVALLIVIILNLGYLISEYKNDFSNTRILFKSERVNNENFLGKLVNNIDCHAEANLYILSSYGSENCNFSYSDILKNKKSKTLIAELKSADFIILIFLQALFAIFGYASLLYLLWREKDNGKKYFLGLITIFIAFFFLLMLFIIGKSFDSFRYFSPTFFVPLIFLGFLIDFINNKLSKKYLVISFAIILFIIITNIVSIKNEFKKFQAGVKSDAYYHYAVLGELESIIRYLVDNSNNQKDIYISGDRFSLLPPLKYIAQRQNVDIIEFDYKKNDAPPSKSVFYITDKLKDAADNYFAMYKIERHKVFGRIIIYKLEN
ncbi:MAG: glycosyltransferase family 39 protein [bacterium]|nr:glycosyltransferase family 39 protein [bacterium]